MIDLPRPQVIEQLDAAACVEARMVDVKARFVAGGLAYDVEGLPYDPVKIQAEVDAAREVNTRARINDAARANIKGFSRGADLDHLAEFYGVERLPDETDERLRRRITLAIQGRSTAGPEERYMSVAMAADGRVADVRVYLVDGGPTIRLALLASDNGGVPDQAMLDAVTAAVTRPDVRVINDVIEVGAAVSTVQNIAANVWLLPDTPFALLEALPQRLSDAWAAEGGIGFDLDPSWIAAKLFVAGVAGVEVIAPAGRVVVDDNHAIALGAVELGFAGRRR